MHELNVNFYLNQFFCLFGHSACGILVPTPEIRCRPLATVGRAVSRYGAGGGRGGGKQSIQSLLELSEGLACAQLPLGLPAALLLMDHTHTGSTSVLGPGPALHCYVGALYS